MGNGAAVQNGTKRQSNPVGVDNFVRLAAQLSSGTAGAGNSIIIDGIMGEGEKRVKVKIFDSRKTPDAPKRVVREQDTMISLTKQSPDYFMKPVGLFLGYKHQIIMCEEKGAFLSQGLFAVAIEASGPSLMDFLKQGPPISIAEVIKYADKLLGILEGAKLCGRVLMNFHLQNIASDVADADVILKDVIKWKIVDSGSSYQVSEPIIPVSSVMHGSPEVAKYMLQFHQTQQNNSNNNNNNYHTSQRDNKPNTNTNPPPPSADSKMDVMAYGWAVYELAIFSVHGQFATYWECGGLPPGVPLEEANICKALAELTDSAMSDHLNRVFPSEQHRLLRVFLEDLLKVNPFGRTPTELIREKLDIVSGKSAKMKAPNVSDKYEAAVAVTVVPIKEVLEAKNVSLTVKEASPFVVPFPSNYVRLSASVSSGFSSSHNITILDGKLGDAGIDVKVKVFDTRKDKTAIQRAVNEYNFMLTLNNSSQDHFIKPFGLFYGNRQEIIPYNIDTDDCQHLIAIAMEAGSMNMRELVIEEGIPSITGLLFYADKLLSILEAANASRIVLMDFKLANVVSVVDKRKGVSKWKAIDFGSTRRAMGPINTEVSAMYSCPEVAKYVLSVAGGNVNVPPPRADHKIDVMAYGWAVFELGMLATRGKLTSFWEAGGLPYCFPANDINVFHALSDLTDEKVSDVLTNVFPGEPSRPLRSFLEDALKVDPAMRASAEKLRWHRSFLGSADRTLDTNSLSNMVSKLNKQVDMVQQGVVEVHRDVKVFHDQEMEKLDVITTKIDGLHELLVGSLMQMGTALDAVAEKAVAGDGTVMKGLSHFRESLVNMRESGSIDEDAVQKAIQSSLKRFLKPEMLTGIMSEAMGNAFGEKMDALIAKVESIEKKLDTFGEELLGLKRTQASLLIEVEKLGSIKGVIPGTFIFVPEGMEFEPLGPQTSTRKKMLNCLNRNTKRLKTFFWKKSRLLFLCPVTQKIVPCGKDGKGYIVETPTSVLKKLIPALAITFFVVKVALASQGMGAVIPNIADFLPEVNSDVLSNIGNSIESGFEMLDLDGVEHTVEEGASLLAGDIVKAVAGNVARTLAAKSMKEIVDESALETVYKLIASEERGMRPDAPIPSWWKPKNLGLILAEHPESGICSWTSPCSCQPPVGCSTLGENDHTCGEYHFRKYGQEALEMNLMGLGRR